jgi:hypothetical protein
MSIDLPEPISGLLDEAVMQCPPAAAIRRSRVAAEPSAARARNPE